MSFIWPWMLISLLLVPLLVGIYIYLFKQRQRSVAESGLLGIGQDGLGSNIGRRRHIPALFFVIGLTFILIGLAFSAFGNVN